jgi:iron complex outermembrane receptor protein
VAGDGDFDTVSASAGAVWLGDRGYAVGASLTRAVRSPSAEELYSCGPHLATQSFEVGNAGLGKETGLALDVSLRKRTGRLTGEIALFLNRFDDYIYEEYTDTIRTEEGEVFDTFATTPAEVVLPEFRFTQADAEFRGAELRAGIDLFSNEAHHVGLELTADTVRAELRDTGENLPRIPAARYGVDLHYHGNRWYGHVAVRHTDEQTRLAPSEVIADPTPNGVEGLDLLGGPTEDYTLVRAVVGYRLVRGGLLHEISLRGSNLTDEEARVHTSRLKNVAPLPGADVSVAYRVVF